MEQPQTEEGFCPACGEPLKDGVIHHDPMCPYSGDDLPPEDGNR